MLVLVVGLETCLEKIGMEYADFGVRDWQKSREEVARDLRGYQILCFGDSQIKTGVVPQIIEARTGLRTHNFAMVGGQAPASYFLLRRALAGNARPGTIVVDFLPPLLSVDLRRSERYLPELIGLKEAAELAWAQKEAGEFLALASAIALPSVRMRNDLGKGIVAAIQGKSASRRAEVPMRRNRRVNQGALLLEPQPLKEDPDLWYRVNYPGPWAPHALEAAYADRFFALAAAHGITVYWLLHPIAPAAQAFCEAGGQDSRYDQFVRRALNRYPNLIAIDGRHSGFGDGLFVDTVHMNVRGAAELSAGLADILESPRPYSSPKERWVALPAYRDRPVTVHLENCTESAQALDPRKSRREENRARIEAGLRPAVQTNKMVR
jgi:hypothetical protein